MPVRHLLTSNLNQGQLNVIPPAIRNAFVTARTLLIAYAQMIVKKKRELLQHPSLPRAISFFAIVGLVATFNTVAVFATYSPVAFGATTVPACSFSQLGVSVLSDVGPNAAAGNDGLPFDIVNRGSTSCSLKGYPRLVFSPSAYGGRTTRILEGGGQIFAPVKPRLVVIQPGATASFGVDYVDADDQQDPNGGPCLTNYVLISLPVRSHPYVQRFLVEQTVNFCYAGFNFSVTSIQHGPIPKGG
jgi:hypothetical protein